MNTLLAIAGMAVGQYFPIYVPAPVYVVPVQPVIVAVPQPAPVFVPVIVVPPPPPPVYIFTPVYIWR